jgi:hypothetical protein
MPGTGIFALLQEAKAEAKQARIDEAKQAERAADVSGTADDWYYAALMWARAGDHDRSRICRENANEAEA